MFYYIKKFWKMSGIIIFMLFIDAGLSSYRSLALMESLEELVRGNFRGFLFWTLLNLLCVVLVQVFVAVEDILGKHVIRKMNNQVRRDMAATNAANEPWRVPQAADRRVSVRVYQGHRPDRKLGMGAVFQLDQHGFYGDA